MDVDFGKGCPPVTKPLDGGPPPKCIDLVELCRRLVAEYQYSDSKFIGHLSSYEADVPVSSAFETVLQATSQTPISSAMRLSMPGLPALAQKKFTKIGMQITRASTVGQCLTPERISRKNFSVMNQGSISTKLVDKLYWMIRLRYTCSFFNMAVGQLIPKLEKMQYKGFQLPNGIAVPLRSLHLMVLYVVPMRYHLFHFEVADKPGVFCKIWMNQFKQTMTYEPEAIECSYAINPEEGPNIQHIVICFNLPDENGEDKTRGRLYIVDPSCAQFGMRGPDGGLVYFGYWEDYLKAFQAEKWTLYEFRRWDYTDWTFFPKGPLLVKNVLKRIALPVCDYCGDTEGRRQIGHELVTVTLKKCSACKETKYCDATCQKVHWPKHKAVCRKPESESVDQA